MRKFVIGVIQMDSQSDVDENLKTASAFIEEAAARGAKLVAMPENMQRSTCGRNSRRQDLSGYVGFGKET